MIKINKNIPRPAYFPDGYYSKYPFRLMEVGDSFLYRKKETKKDLLLASAISAKVSKKLNKQFKFGRVKNSIRIWRIL